MLNIKVEYTVVSRNTIYELSEEIQMLSREGWKLQGGIAVHRSSYIQAMYREIG